MRRLIPALVLVLFAGCARTTLKVEKTIDVDTGGLTFNVDPAKAEQTISVSAKAEGGPIDVYMFLTKNRATIEREMTEQKVVSAIQKAEKSEDVSLQAKVPAGEETSVWVRASGEKKAHVVLKIQN